MDDTVARKSYMFYTWSWWWFCEMSLIRIHYKVWDEIIYPFLHFNGATIEV